MEIHIDCILDRGEIKEYFKWEDLIYGYPLYCSWYNGNWLTLEFIHDEVIQFFHDFIIVWRNPSVWLSVLYYRWDENQKAQIYLNATQFLEMEWYAKNYTVIICFIKE